MTNQEFSRSYFEQARAIYEELVHDYESKRWHLVVRRAQECVELILKGFLRQAGLEVPRLHDVGNLLQNQAKRLPQKIGPHLARMVSISRRLRLERETSFYGDEEQELPPAALYTQLDADQAKQDVEWLMQFVPKSN